MTYNVFGGTLNLAQSNPILDISPCVMTADLVHLLQTRFGTQRQAECFKAELCARRKAQRESLQSLHQYICRLVTLAYPSAEVSLDTLVGKEAFTAAQSDGKLQLEVMKQEVSIHHKCGAEVLAFTSFLLNFPLFRRTKKLLLRM